MSRARRGGRPRGGCRDHGARRRQVSRLHGEGRLDGILALGGSGGTAVATEAMRALPVGVPKLMVSTMASGHAPYVGATDVTMTYSVVDIAGINAVSARILANAAAAMAGMVTAEPPAVEGGKPLVGATMFGVTTPCVTAARERLEARLRGARLPRDRHGRAVDGGAHAERLHHRRRWTSPRPSWPTTSSEASSRPARPARGRRRARDPQVVSLGALDMVNFGPVETVPVEFATGSSTSTTRRSRSCARRRRSAPSSGGASAQALGCDRAGDALHPASRGVAHRRGGPGLPRPEADRALFDGLRETLDPGVDVRELDTDVNDPGFAHAMVDTLHEHYRAWTAGGAHA